MSAETNRRMVEQCRLLDEALADLARHSAALADAERDYRIAKAKAWADAVEQQATAKHKEAVVDARVADLRRTRDLAEYLRGQSLEVIRAARAQLSAWQSMAAGERAEAELARTGPQ